MNTNTLGLSPKAFQITKEKPEAWEFVLFAQVIIDQIEENKIIVHQSHYPAPVEVSGDELQNVRAVTAFMLEKFDSHQIIMDELEGLIGANHEDTFGDPDEAKRMEAIVLLSRKVGALHRQFIEWALPFFNLPAHLPFSDMLIELGSVASNILAAGLERFGPKLIQQIADAKSGLLGEEVVIDALEWIEKSEIDRGIEKILEFNEKFKLEARTCLTKLQTEYSSKSGYLYAAYNPSIPGQVKIGKTTRSPDDRVKELGTATGVPTPFILIYETVVNDCDAAEKYVHDMLRNHRVSMNREFFRISAPEAVNALLAVQEQFAT